MPKKVQPYGSGEDAETHDGDHEQRSGQDVVDREMHHVGAPPGPEHPLRMEREDPFQRSEDWINSTLRRFRAERHPFLRRRLHVESHLLPRPQLPMTCSPF